MPKFVLIDHSIRKFGGHHFEYAVHVLRAAEKAGYKAVLATNRDFTRDGRDQWDAYPTYEYDFWGGSRRLRQGQRRLRTWIKAAKGVMLRIKLKAGYSKLGLLLMARHQPDVLLSMVQSERTQLSLWQVLLLFPLAYGWVVLKAVREWFRTLLRPIWRSFVGDILRATWSVFLSLLFPIRMARRYRVQAIQAVWKRRRVAAFERDTRALFRRIALEEGDIVFVPTLSEIDLKGLMQYLKTDARSAKASWHLLFRRNIYQGREPNYPEQERQLQGLRAIFQTFQESVPQHRTFLYTDTEQLTAQWNRLHAGEFTTLPIPVNERFQSKPEQPTEFPLSISYIGDARSEKGYQFLPGIVTALWNDYVETGKVRFVFQSNFAFSAPESQASVVVARQLMERLDPKGMTVIREPLDSDQYCDLVLQSDIGLLLYDRENYYARSSGALVEYLTAGVPIVVTSGSWLSTQIEAEIYQHQLNLRDTLPKVVSFPAEELEWQVTYRKQGATPLLNGRLTFAGHAARSFAWVEIPEGATHLAVSFKISDLTLVAQSGAYVQVHAEMLDENKVSVGKSVAVIGQAAGAGIHTVRLLPGTRCVWLGFQNAYHSAPITIEALQVDLLAAEGEVPLGAVGLVAATMDEVADHLRDIADHYGHYRQTAVAFAQRWNARHNPDALFRDLLERSGSGTALQQGGRA